MSKKIGQRIKERTKALGMTVEELAQRTGKDRSTIYRYEKGDIENVPLDILKPLASALDTTEHYLMGWDKEKIKEIAAMQAELREEEKMQEILIKMMMKKKNEDPAFNTKLFIDNCKKWMDSVNEIQFTSKEMEQLINFAKYLIHSRKE